MLTETLKELCALPGVSGCEDAVREYIVRRVSKVTDDLFTDPIGNLIVNVKGKKTPERKIMLAAHMDEVGMIVTGFTDSGFVKFDFVGSVDRRVVIGKRVDIHTDGGVFPGAIGLKPIHLVKEDERRRIPPVTGMYIDLGFESREEAEKKIALGDRVCFDAGITLFGDGFIKAKAIDDRIGCAVMLEMIEKGPAADCT
ncbi:MAG: M42 family peptidase, partial [Oscillospiraceae bacterium]|nr:M42 family peptidase [Oscillospiraceae bacterium]